MAVIAGDEVAVVFQDVDRFGDAAWCIRYGQGKHLFQAPPGSGREHVTYGGLGEDRDGNCVAFIFQGFSKSRLVVREIVLSRRTEKLRAVNSLHIPNGYQVPSLH